MFPSISDDKAVQLLHDCSYDMEQTVNRLFDQDTTDETTADAAGDTWVESKSKKGRKKPQERDAADDFKTRTQTSTRGMFFIALHYTLTSAGSCVNLQSFAADTPLCRDIAVYACVWIISCGEVAHVAQSLV